MKDILKISCNMKKPQTFLCSLWKKFVSIMYHAFLKNFTNMSGTYEIPCICAYPCFEVGVPSFILLSFSYYVLCAERSFQQWTIYFHFWICVFIDVPLLESGFFIWELSLYYYLCFYSSVCFLTHSSLKQSHYLYLYIPVQWCIYLYLYVYIYVFSKLCICVSIYVLDTKFFRIFVFMLSRINPAL